MSHLKGRDADEYVQVKMNKDLLHEAEVLSG